MSREINQANWEIINIVNHEIKENDTAQKQVAQANYAYEKQKLAKDTLLTTAEDGQVEKVSTAETDLKPKLPPSKSTFAGLKGDDVDKNGNSQPRKTICLMAVIGEVMIQQSKSNSNYWSTLWKQASQ